MQHQIQDLRNVLTVTVSLVVPFSFGTNRIAASRVTLVTLIVDISYASESLGVFHLRRFTTTSTLLKNNRLSSIQLNFSNKS